MIYTLKSILSFLSHNEIKKGNPKAGIMINNNCSSILLTVPSLNKKLIRLIKKYRIGGAVKKISLLNDLEYSLYLKIQSSSPLNRKNPSGYNDHDLGNDMRNNVAIKNK